MRRRISLTLILMTCALAVAPAAYASWQYATQTTTGADTVSRSATSGCSVRTVYSSLRLYCGVDGVARATYAFKLPSNIAGRPGAYLVPAIGPYTASVRVSGSRAYVTVKVTRGLYVLKWVNLVYYTK